MSKITLIILVNSSDKQNFTVLDKTVFSAFEHFGMPYETLDLAKSDLNMDMLKSYSAIIIAQENLGKKLSSAEFDAIKEAVYKGTGLINFDPYMISSQESLRSMLHVISVKKDTQALLLKIKENKHYITNTYEAFETWQLTEPLDMISVSIGQDARMLLENQDGLPVIFTGKYGNGKIVQFTVSPKLWLFNYFGHCRGIDGLFWRAIVWITRKPFIMKAMPPFVTAKIDDCYGSSNPYAIKENSAARRFNYIKTLNKYKYRPNIGLFMDEIISQDIPIIKSIYEKGLAEFSPHAFKEDKPGEDNMIYMRRIHNSCGEVTGVEEFDPQHLSETFSKLDQKFQKWGIKPSRVFNTHYQNAGVNCLPFLKERGQIFSPCVMDFGYHLLDPKGWHWRKAPYGSTGYVFDYMPGNSDFFCVSAKPYRSLPPDDNIPYNGLNPDVDILCGYTTFKNENNINDLETIANRAARSIKYGLDSLFFGCFMTHEQRISALSIEEWDEILNIADKLTSKYEKIFVTYEYIAEYAKSKCDSKIKDAYYKTASKKISCKLTGRTSMPIKLYVFTDNEKNGCTYTFKEVPQFEGEIRISFGLYNKNDVGVMNV